MNYANIKICGLLYMYNHMHAESLYNFEGFACDGDKQQINAVFNEAQQVHCFVIEAKTKSIQLLVNED